MPQPKEELRPDYQREQVEIVRQVAGNQVAEKVADDLKAIQVAQHLAQFRPQAGGPLGSAHYSPQRDIAHVGVALLAKAISGLDDPTKWPSWISDLFKQRQLTIEDVGIAAQSLGRGISSFTGDPLVNDPHSALLAAGWFNQSPEVRYAIYSRIGEVFLGALFSAMRDVTEYGATSTHRRSVLEIAEAARMIGKQISVTASGGVA